MNTTQSSSPFQKWKTGESTEQDELLTLLFKLYDGVSANRKFHLASCFPEFFSHGIDWTAKSRVNRLESLIDEVRDGFELVIRQYLDNNPDFFFSHDAILERTGEVMHHIERNDGIDFVYTFNSQTGEPDQYAIKILEMRDLRCIARELVKHSKN